MVASENLLTSVILLVGLCYCAFRTMKYTSLRCRKQTRATQCLTPTVLYTDVDGQCDKLVTDDRH